MKLYNYETLRIMGTVKVPIHPTGTVHIDVTRRAN